MPATAGVVDLARGEDARVAGVVDLARGNGRPPRRAFMTCEGKVTAATAGGFGSGIGGIGGGGGGKAGNTKVAGPRKSTVKQKTKLAMDPPNRVPFVRNPTSARSSRNAPMPFATVTNSSSSPIPICREKSSCSGKSGSMAKSPMRRSNPRR